MVQESPDSAQRADNGIFTIIQDTINAEIKKICVNAASLTDVQQGSNKQKIGDFYASGKDSVAINRQKLQALQSELSKINSANSMQDLIKEAAHIHAIAGSPMFSFYVGQDDKISSKNAIFSFTRRIEPAGSQLLFYR